MKDINIAEILKNKPEGTQLYSPVCGKCTFVHVGKDDVLDEYIRVVNIKEYELGFTGEGRLYDDGEPILFPSKNMQDWTKFAWKKGNVLISNDGKLMGFFDGWYKDDYTQVRLKHQLDFKDKNNLKYSEENQPLTSLMCLEESKVSCKVYIDALESFLGGKLNMETLEVEKPKCTFKPFDKVLVRGATSNKWICAIFSHINNATPLNMFVANSLYWTECIPYNEKTAHLIGTTDNWEE